MTTSEVLAGKSNAPEHWGPVLEMAVREVFELMLGCQLTTTESTTADPMDVTAMDVTAMVGLAGRLSGLVSVQCSTKSATMMASKMLGVEPDQIGPEMCDAFGEICNMVAGNFKNKITGLGDGCLLSVPTVITGNDYSLHSMIDAPKLEVRLQFEGRPLVISLQIND